MSSLLIGNLIPLFGVVFLNWSISTIFLAYWLETVIIGSINFLNLLAIRAKNKLFVFLLAVFFSFHFGLYSYGLLLFYLNFIEKLDISLVSIILSSIGLMANHFYNYFHTRHTSTKYETILVAKLMFAPYKRILIMQFSMALFIILTASYLHTIGAKVVLIGIKTVIDSVIQYRLHYSKHESS